MLEMSLKQERIMNLLDDLENEFDPNVMFEDHNGIKRTIKEHATQLVEQALEFQKENQHLHFYTCLVQVEMDDESVTI